MRVRPPHPAGDAGKETGRWSRGSGPASGARRSRRSSPGARLDAREADSAPCRPEPLAFRRRNRRTRPEPGGCWGDPGRVCGGAGLHTSGSAVPTSYCGEEEARDRRVSNSVPRALPSAYNVSRAANGVETFTRFIVSMSPCRGRAGLILMGSRGKGPTPRSLPASERPSSPLPPRRPGSPADHPGRGAPGRGPGPGRAGCRCFEPEPSRPNPGAGTSGTRFQRPHREPPRGRGLQGPRGPRRPARSRPLREAHARAREEGAAAERPARSPGQQDRGERRLFPRESSSAHQFQHSGEVTDPTFSLPKAASPEQRKYLRSDPDQVASQPEALPRAPASGLTRSEAKGLARRLMA